MNSYWVYIMASKSRALYIGMTNNLQGRVLKHKHGQASKHSTKYRTRRLVYYEEFGDVWDAIRAEKLLKGWRREKKVTLIESMNPEWKDLAEDIGL